MRSACCRLSERSCCVDCFLAWISTFITASSRAEAYIYAASLVSGFSEQASAFPEAGIYASALCTSPVSQEL